MKRWIAILLSAALISGCAACGGTDEGNANSGASGTANEGTSANAGGSAGSAETVKIGVMLPLTGANANSGEYQLEGMQMAVDYVNEHGGIQSMGGAQVDLVVSDTEGDVENGMTEIERLISVEQVSALCGPYNSTVAASTAPIAIQYGIPYVIVNAVADNIMQNGANNYVYRVNFGSGDMAPFRRMVMEYLGSLLPAGKFQKIAIIYDAGDWGTSECETYTAAAQELGVEVVVSEAITTNSSDLSSLVNKIKNSGAEAVFCGIFLNDALLFCNTMREYDCDVQIVGSGNGFSDSKFAEGIGNNGDGILATRAFNPSFGTAEGEATTLYQEYLASHDNVPMPEETSNGFCGMSALLIAIENAGSDDREAIANALHEMDLGPDSMPLWYSMFDGVNFNTDGDDLGRYNQNSECGETAGQILVQLFDQQWELVWPTERATADIVFGG